MNEVIFVPDGEFVTYSCPLPEGEDLNVRMEFPDDNAEDGSSDEKKSEARFLVEYESAPGTIEIECMILKFFNFGTGLGQSLINPIPVAVSETKNVILFLASVQKLLKMKKVEFQFVLGEHVDDYKAPI